MHGENRVFPALSIPVHKKDEFSCPSDHVEKLAELMRQTTKVLTIGWRASEDKFLEIVRSPTTGVDRNKIDLLVVSGDPKGAEETAKNLGLGDLPERFGTFTSGFTGLINNLPALNAFLRQTPWQKRAQ